MKFPKDFVWGAAAAAYQIEGAAYEDGKGLSVWDMFCKIPGAIKDGHTGDVACDHYHRYEEDVQLMKEIGIQAYRMSISWPRILPEGTGKINEKGLDFYDRLIDELLKNNIVPYVTLFHWDYPYELYKKGGWLNPDSSDWFAEYARIVVERFSDRVSHWMTLNEPQIFVLHGHQTGKHAPGLRLGLHDILQMIHNVHLAHGKGVMTIRQYSKQPCKVGWAPTGSVRYPASNSPEDIEAARKEMFSVNPKSLFGANSWWCDPVYLGKYPEDGLKELEPWLPKMKQDDLKIIHQPMDFVGLNIYNGSCIRAGKDGKAETVKRNPGYAETLIKWPVTPEALYWGPRFHYERYKKPIIMTENGLSCMDWVHLDGKVHDPQRIDFLTRYLRAFGQAGLDGVEIAGYFQWSIMDNFEWGEGYHERFGLIHVDYETQKRTIKDSGYWYRKVIESNGEIL